MRRPFFLLTFCLSALCLSALTTDVVRQYYENISSWAKEKNISYVMAIEDLLSTKPSFRMGDRLMYQLAEKNDLAKTDTYEWDVYVPNFNKEIDKGITVSYSDIVKVPEEYVDQKYPGFEYVSCSVRISGSISVELKDLFILRDNRIVKITDYVETTDAVTGKKKIEVDYIELARAAFADGNYQKCYDLYKEGGLKKIKEICKEGKLWLSYSDIFPYIESCVALNDWDGAMYGFTRKMDRKYTVNGTEWKLDPEDIQTWNKAKAPLMDVLLKKLYLYYSENYDGFMKSPLIKHVQSRTGLPFDYYRNSAAQYFWINNGDYYYREPAVQAAAEFGHTDAQRELGKYYLKGHNLDDKEVKREIMVPCDTVKAVEWFDKAALNGDAESARIAAFFHLTGTGKDRDFDKAFRNYSIGKDALDYDIRYGLGLCYYYGLGTPRNYQEALQHLLFAEDWHPDVPYLIGNIYYSLSDPKAVKYYRKVLQRKGVDDGVRHDILTILSECNRAGKCGLTVNAEEADRLQAESQKFPAGTPEEIKEYLISLTQIDLDNDTK